MHSERHSSMSTQIRTHSAVFKFSIVDEYKVYRNESGQTAFLFSSTARNGIDEIIVLVTNGNMLKIFCVECFIQPSRSLREANKVLVIQ